jgi:hypothetical protein
MLYSLLRSPKVRQVGQIALHISVNGTATTPVASGPDAVFVQSITDNGTGDYTITLKESAKMNLVVSSIALATADATAYAFAVTKNTVQIKARSVAGSPAAKDVDFTVTIQYFDQLTYFF